MFSDVSPTASVSYKNIFDLSIYEQTDFVFSAYLDKKDEDELHKALIEHLNKKKLDRLHHVLLKNSGAKIDTLTKIVGEGTKFWNYFFRPVFGGMPFISVDSIEKSFSTMPKDEAKKELFKLGFQVQLLRDGIDKEPIYALEKVYVTKKKKVVSDDVRHQIEKALLSARDDAIYLELTRQFIDTALAMPSEHLQVSHDKLTLIDTSSFFRNFEPGLRAKLRLIAHKFIVDSNQPSDSGRNNRGIYYFQGDPGTGKSRAAVKLLDCLDLPYFVLTVRRLEDLSSENLEGSARTLMSHNPGIIAKTLLSKNNRNATPYLNATLILDDFDRVLFAQKKGGTPSALSFLLDYLDPGKRTYPNPYFNADLDISRLSIIITANKPIPKVKHTSTGKIADDPYTALRSRVTEVLFPNFPDETLQAILMPIAKSLVEKYDFAPVGFSSMPEEEQNKFVTPIIEDAIAKQKQITSVLEPRDMERQLELIISAKKLNIELQDNVPEQDTKEDFETLKTLGDRFSELSESFNTYKKDMHMMYVRQNFPSLDSLSSSSINSSSASQASTKNLPDALTTSVTENKKNNVSIHT